MVPNNVLSRSIICISKFVEETDKFDPARGRQASLRFSFYILDYNGYVRWEDRCGFISRVRRICAEFSMRFSSPSKTSTQKHKLRLRDLGYLTRFAAEAVTSETPARIAAERRSVEEAGEIGAKKLPRTSPPPRHIEDSSSMEEGESSAEESSVEIASAKSAKPVIAQSSPAAKAAESVSARTKGALRTGSSSLPNFCRKSTELYKKFVSDKKMRSHTFEMAHNKQLKVVLRGLPTDYNRDTLMYSELHTLGFKPNHISLLKNRKTNTNMPLFFGNPR
ncbi:hypothetical protein TNCV_3494681 [Trichonephila clavipes]|nr:hypothetical protein TNCV_3494681 [Trichonephila clavipes]